MSYKGLRRHAGRALGGGDSSSCTKLARGRRTLQLEAILPHARRLARGRRLSHPHVVVTVIRRRRGDDGHRSSVFDYVRRDASRGLIKRVGPLPVTEGVGLCDRGSDGPRLDGGAARRARLVHRRRLKPSESADRPRRGAGGRKVQRTFRNLPARRRAPTGLTGQGGGAVFGTQTTSLPNRQLGRGGPVQERHLTRSGSASYERCSPGGGFCRSSREKPGRRGHEEGTSAETGRRTCRVWLRPEGGRVILSARARADRSEGGQTSRRQGFVLEAPQKTRDRPARGGRTWWGRPRNALSALEVARLRPNWERQGRPP